MKVVQLFLPFPFPRSCVPICLCSPACVGPPRVCSIPCCGRPCPGPGMPLEMKVLLLQLTDVPAVNFPAHPDLHKTALRGKRGAEAEAVFSATVLPPTCLPPTLGGLFCCNPPLPASTEGEGAGWAAGREQQEALCLPPGTPAEKQVLAFLTCEWLWAHLPEYTVGKLRGRGFCLKKKQRKKKHVLHYKWIACLEINVWKSVQLRMKLFFNTMS